MSEENQKEATTEEESVAVNSQAPTEVVPQVEPASEQAAPVKQESPKPNMLVNPMTGEVESTPGTEKTNIPTYGMFKPETYINPMTGEEEQTTLGTQVIIKKDRGLAYYVGFAMLVVLSTAFFFMPGIAITFAASRLVDLNTSAAWVFSAILSFVVWLLFKMKIKGFGKSFNWYLALSVTCVVALIIIQFITEYNIFSEVVALLIGAKA